MITKMPHRFNATFLWNCFRFNFRLIISISSYLWSRQSWNPYRIASNLIIQRGVTWQKHQKHYNDVILSAMASQITSLATVYSTVYSGADQRKHQSSASLRWPVNSPHKGPVTRKIFPFHDVIMTWLDWLVHNYQSNNGSPQSDA